MVREIIHVQVGQCGNQVGSAFMKAALREHAIDSNTGTFNDTLGKPPTVLEKVNVYFAQTKNLENKAEARWVPRSVIVDLEPGTIDVIKKLPMANIIKPDNMIFGANGAGNNWAKGHYTEGAEKCEEVLEAIRKETENCDCPQGFQLMHSIGGGTGSGMGTLLLLKIRDSYPDRITTTYSIYPSKKVSDVVVEPYNAVLSTHQLLENADQTFMFDNEALYQIAHNVLKIGDPDYASLNYLISQSTCGVTASLRFPGKLNGDLRKLGTNLVPFPRLHFFMCSYAPLLSKETEGKVNLTTKECLSQVYSKRNFYALIDLENGKNLAISIVFRGKQETSVIEELCNNLQQKRAEDFVEWIPNNIKTSVVNENPNGSDYGACMVANTTALKEVFQRLATQFGAMYKRKAFLHWYKGEGMDEMEFQEADKNLRDLITEYQDKQDAEYQEEEEAAEEDEEI